MGRAKAKQHSRKQMLLDHPFCVYCGKAANTIDHCPPRSFFSKRIGPEGFEFPACSACNDFNRGDEQIAAVLARISLSEKDPAGQREWKKLCDGVKNNHPEVVAEWLSKGEASRKRFFREAFGPDVGDAFRHAGFGSIVLGPLTRSALRRVAVKIGQALFYRHIDRIFEGDIYVHQLDAFAKNLDEKMQKVVQFAPFLEMPARGKQKLDEQFQYRFNVSKEHGALNLVVRFGEQIAFQIFVLAPALAQQLLDTYKDQPLPEHVLMRFEIRLSP